MSAEVWLDLLTGLLFIATTATAVVAYLGVKQAQSDVATARAEAAAEREANAEARRNEFQAQVVLDIAQAWESWRANGGISVDEDRIKALLSALPVNDLEMLRYKFGVFPNEHARVRWTTSRDDLVRYAKITDEITAKLHRLTGLPPQSHEPAKAGIHDLPPAEKPPGMEHLPQWAIDKMVEIADQLRSGQEPTSP